MALLFLLIPAIAYEGELHTPLAWDAGYLKAPIILPKTTVRYNTGETVGNGSCVSFIKLTLGVSDSWYTPRYVWEHHEFLGLKIVEPKEGAIIITSEGRVWHMGLVEKVNISSIIIIEQNFKDKFISIRELSKTSPKIVGFIETTK